MTGPFGGPCCWHPGAEVSLGMLGMWGRGVSAGAGAKPCGAGKAGYATGRKGPCFGLGGEHEVVGQDVPWESKCR